MNLLSLVDIYFRRYASLFLRLTVRTFSGLVGEAASPPITFTTAFWNSWHLAISGIFNFYKLCCPIPWSFGKILRAPLRSWGFHIEFLGVRRFWRRFRSCQKIYCQFPRDLLRLFHPILLEFSTLVAGLMIIQPLFSGGIYAGYCSSISSLCDRGSKFIGRNASRLRAMSW